MPQLDFYSIANQLVFGSLSFIFFYLIIELYIVPTLFTSIFARDYYLKNTRNNINTLFYYTFFAFYIFSRLVDEAYAIASSSENNLNYLVSIDKGIFSKNFVKDDFSDIILLIHEDVRPNDLDVDFEYSSNNFKSDEPVNFDDIESSEITEEENPVFIDNKPFRFQFLFTNIEEKVPSVKVLNEDISALDLQKLQKAIVDQDMEGGIPGREDSVSKNEEHGFDIEPRPSEFSKEAEDYALKYMVSYLKDRHNTYLKLQAEETLEELREYREFMEEEEEGEEEGQDEDEDEDEDEESLSDFDLDFDENDDSPVYLDYLDLLEFFREEGERTEL
jgi:hypothetical protein